MIETATPASIFHYYGVALARRVWCSLLVYSDLFIDLLFNMDDSLISVGEGNSGSRKRQRKPTKRERERRER